MADQGADQNDNGTSLYRAHTSVIYGMLVSAMGIIIGFAWRDAFVTEMQGTEWMRRNGYLVFAVFITILGSLLILYLNRRIRRNREKSRMEKRIRFMELELKRRGHRQPPSRPSVLPQVGSSAND
jgi:hypothetical protein